MTTQNKRLIAIVCAVPALLAVPLIAMRLSPEVRWGTPDFLVAGGLLLGTGLVCEVALRTIKTTRNRVLACLAVLGVGFLVWAELAVGVFGSPLAGS